MKASLIVPVYDLAAGNKVRFCLEALLAQDLAEPYEIIAVDDRSADDSFQILKEFEARFPGKLMALQNEKHAMQGAAKNLGLSHAKGEWIGFIDGDDWVSQDYLSALISLGEAEEADIVGCDLQLTHEQSFALGQQIKSNDPSQAGELDHAKYASLILDSGSLCTKLYRRHIIFDYDNRFPEGIFYEDNAISNSWFLRAKRFSYLPKPLYYYYQHNTSTVHTITKERCENRMEAARLMLSEAERFGYFEEYKAELEASFATLFYVNTLFSYVRGVKHPEAGFVKAMGEEMLKTFPEFRRNPYYLKRTNEEERRLIDMQLASTGRFLLYDRLLQTWRSFRKRFLT